MCPMPDSARPHENAAGKNYGNACVHGRGVELSGTLRSICRIRRGRRVGAVARVRASFVSGSKRCRKRKRIFRIVPGRIKGGGCRNISGVDFRVSCKLDFPAEDEKIAGEKLRRSRRTDIIKKNAAEKSRIAAAGRIQKKRVFCGKNIKTPATGRKEVCNEDKRRSAILRPFLPGHISGSAVPR